MMWQAIAIYVILGLIIVAHVFKRFIENNPEKFNQTTAFALWLTFVFFILAWPLLLLFVVVATFIDLYTK
jgi:hypothetical protein